MNPKKYINMMPHLKYFLLIIEHEYQLHTEEFLVKNDIMTNRKR